MVNVREVVFLHQKVLVFLFDLNVVVSSVEKIVETVIKGYSLVFVSGFCVFEVFEETCCDVDVEAVDTLAVLFTFGG